MEATQITISKALLEHFRTAIVDPQTHKVHRLDGKLTPHYFEKLLPICFRDGNLEAAKEILSWEEDNEVKAEQIRCLFETHKESVQTPGAFKLLLSQLSSQVHFSDTVVVNAIETKDLDLIILSLQTLHIEHCSNEFDFSRLAQALGGKHSEIISLVVTFLNRMPRYPSRGFETLSYNRSVGTLTVETHKVTTC